MQRQSFDWDPWEPSPKLKRMVHQQFRYVFFALGLLLVAVCLVVLHLDVISGSFQRQSFGILFGCLGGAMIFLSYPAWTMRVAGVGVALLLTLCSRVSHETILDKVVDDDGSMVAFARESGEAQPQTREEAAETVRPSDEAVPVSQNANDDVDTTTYRDGDLDPLFRKLADRQGKGEVVGIWMRGSDARTAEVVSAFLKRMAQTREMPEYHGRQGGGLFIVDQTPLSFEELSRIVARIGTLELSDSSLHFIDVALDRNLFESSAPAKVLNNPVDPYYLESNLRELRNLDARRVAAAARRLALFHPDKPSLAVSTVLSERLREPWGNDAEYVTSLAAALGVWAPKGDENTRLLLAYTVDNLMRTNLPVPFAAVDYLLVRDDDKSAELLLSLWKLNPEQWETRCAQVGNKLENGILSCIDSAGTPDETRESGVRILGKIGGTPSLLVLKTFGLDKNSRLGTFSRLAQEEIERRLHP